MTITNFSPSSWNLTQEVVWPVMMNQSCYLAFSPRPIFWSRPRISSLGRSSAQQQCCISVMKANQTFIFTPYGYLEMASLTLDETNSSPTNCEPCSSLLHLSCSSSVVTQRSEGGRWSSVQTASLIYSVITFIILTLYVWTLEYHLLCRPCYFKVTIYVDILKVNVILILLNTSLWYVLPLLQFEWLLDDRWKIKPSDVIYCSLSSNVCTVVANELQIDSAYLSQCTKPVSVLLQV